MPKYGSYPPAATLVGTEITAVVQSGATVKATVQNIADLAGSGSWTSVTLTNSWVAHADWAGQAPQYRLTGNTVELRGLVENGTLAAAIFTLPAGFRPLLEENFIVSSIADDGTFIPGLCVITTAGAVRVEACSTERVSLSGIQFRSA